MKWILCDDDFVQIDVYLCVITGYHLQALL